jgi:glycosyltransferase involved in cell wall biosynthesis
MTEKKTSERITVLIVCDVLGEENNGTTIAAMNLIRYLKSRGHEVRVLCPDADKKGLDGYYVVPTLNLGGPLNRYVKKVGVELAKADASVIKEALAGVDHVHVMLPFPVGSKAAKMAKEMGLPVTAGFHMQAENFTSYIKMNKLAPLNHAVYKYVWRALYRHVDAIHYPTEFIKGVFESHIKKETRGYVISNGVHSYVERRESKKPPELERRTVNLSTGRYAREKSQDTLIKAMKYSRHKDEIQLILAGQGVKEKSYRRLAKKVGTEPIFKLYSRNELIDVLNYSDIYAHPAEVELEGIACLEAIAVGKLAIVSDSRHAATGSFALDDSCRFKVRRPKELARVIDYWIEHPELRRAYGDRYLESAVIYAQDTCMKRMEEMILEVRNENKC